MTLRSSRWKRRVLLIMAAAVFVLGGLVVFEALRPVAGFPPLPEPNGYTDLVGAGKAIQGSGPGSLLDPTVSLQSVREFLEPNREPLVLARAGLSKECAVPVGSSRADLDARLNALGPLRALGRLFFAEGRVAEADGRSAEAVRSYADIVRLAQAVGRGGVMIDDQTGLAIEYTGLVGIAGMQAKLSAADDRALARFLLDIDANTTPPERVAARERLWFRRAAGTWERTMLQLTGVGARQLAPAIASLTMQHCLAQARRRLLAAELALAAYHEEANGYPDRLESLVPRDLPSVPIDPFSGRALVYKRSAQAYLIYSLGPDGLDNGGQPIEKKSDWRTATGDILTPPR